MTLKKKAGMPKTRTCKPRKRSSVTKTLEINVSTKEGFVFHSLPVKKLSIFTNERTESSWVVVVPLIPALRRQRQADPRDF